MYFILINFLVSKYLIRLKKMLLSFGEEYLCFMNTILAYIYKKYLLIITAFQYIREMLLGKVSLTNLTN